MQPDQAEPLDAASWQLWADRFAPVLGEDERVDLVVKATKMVPAIGYLALTDRRFVALPARPHATTTPSASMPLDAIAEVSFRGRKLDVVDPAGGVTRFGDRHGGRRAAAGRARTGRGPGGDGTTAP